MERDTATPEAQQQMPGKPAEPLSAARLHASGAARQSEGKRQEHRAGLILLIAMAIGRRVLGRPGGFMKGWEVPYGVAIAAGFLLTGFLP